MRKVQQNEKPLVLQCNKDGVWEKYEPYMTIECPTEEDYDFIVRAVEYYKQSKQSVGEWIWDKEHSNYKCSLCGEYDVTTPKFCRGCGARMKGGD